MKVLSLVAGAMSLFSVASGLALRDVEDGTTFNLYAYNDDLGGIQLCAKDGLAYIVDTKKVTLTSIGAAPVEFTKQGNYWLASTNATSNSTALDQARFYVPTPGASSTGVGFLATDADTSTVEAEGFEFYGKLALHINQTTGDIQTKFFAQSTGQDGVQALLWDAADATDATTVELRAMAPLSGSTSASA